MKTSGKDLSGLHHLLVADHARLDQLLVQLEASLRAEHSTFLLEPWRAAEAGLREHMAAEEEHMLPLFAKEHAAEAAALAAEHTALRKALDELGVGVELHCVRADQIEDLVRKVRGHSAREEALLYRWTDRNAPSPVWEAVRRRLSRAASSAQASAAPAP